VGECYPDGVSRYRGGSNHSFNGHPPLGVNATD